MRKLVAAADDKGVEGIARTQLGCAIPVEARLRWRCGRRCGGKPAIMPDRRGRWIIFRGHELHVIETQPQVVDGFLDQVGILVASVAELYCEHAYEQHSSARVAEARRLQPGVVGMPVDLFFQRVQDAQPRIGGKARAWNGHNKFSWGCGQSSARYQIISTTMLSFSSSGTAMPCRPFALGSENFC